MPDIRPGSTFNCENLMDALSTFAGLASPIARPSRLTDVDNVQVAEPVDSVFNVLSEDDGPLTAAALWRPKADVCAPQEVENIVTLTAFDTRYIARNGLASAIRESGCWHEGNDTRASGCGTSVAPAHGDLPAQRHSGSARVVPPEGHDANDHAFRPRLP